MKINVYKIAIMMSAQVLFYSCNDAARKLTSYSEKTCPELNDSCQINLELALGVEYDSLYLFTESTQAIEIEKIIGITYRNESRISDSEWRLILVRGHKIVYEGDIQTSKVRFDEVTECRDTINLNANYLLHTSPFYTVSKRSYNKSNEYLFFKHKTRAEQFRRIDYHWRKGYTFISE